MAERLTKDHDTLLCEHNGSAFYAAECAFTLLSFD